MSWIIYDLLMLLSSVVLYLTIRKSSIDKLPTQFNNLGIFLIPCVFYNAAAIIFFYGYHLSLQNLFIIVFAGVFFAYGCSVISLKSIEWAPNPGYSLMISKNYVVMTSFLAVPLFHQTLTLRAVLAILMIVGFSSLIMLNKKSKRRKIHGDRVLFAVVAFLGWGFLSLTAKYLYGQGVPPIVFLACLSAVGAGCIIIEMLAKKVSLKPFKAHASSFVLIGLASAAFNFFNFYTVKVAPNIGYVNATNAASIGLLTLAAAWLFHDELNTRKLIGIAGCIGALVLLLLK